MGFGHSTAEFPPERFAFAAYSFGPSMRLVAEAVGLPLDSVTATGEVAVTPEKLTIAAGTLDAGTVAGQRLIVTGTHAGRAVITFTGNACGPVGGPALAPSAQPVTRAEIPAMRTINTDMFFILICNPCLQSMFVDQCLLTNVN